MTCDDLRHIIGKQLNYKGHSCEIIEVLEDGPQLVLRNLDYNPIADEANDGRNPIQPNQFGEAHRRTPETFTVPALDKNQRPIAFLEKLVNAG
jgi:hypothetical protein